MGDLSIFSRVTLNDLLQFKKANSEKKKILYSLYLILKVHIITADFGIFENSKYQCS